MDLDKGTTADISFRLNKSRAAFCKLKKASASNQYTRRTNIRIYNSNVMTVLLYGSECWTVNKRDKQKAKCVPQ